MYKLITLLFALCLANTAQAESFQFKKGDLIAKIQVAKCDENHCSGASHIELNTGKYTQSFNSEDSTFYRKHKNKPFQFDDFLNSADYNFDGLLDIAISQGNYGSYGSPIYDIYVQTQSGKFVLSDELTTLASSDFIGLPEVDSKNNLLKVFSKVGYRERIETHYLVRENQTPMLQPVYEHHSEFLLDDTVRETTTIWKNSKKATTITIITKPINHK